MPVMLDRLLEFTQLCRKNGMRVSTAEVLDALAAAEVIGLEDGDALKGALQATLVKRNVDEAAFSELYDLFFFRKSRFLDETADDAPLVEALRGQGLSEEQIEHLLAILADEAARMSPLARAGVGLRRTPIEALIRLAGIKVDFSRLQNPLQIGFFTQSLLESLSFRQATEELNNL